MNFVEVTCDLGGIRLGMESAGLTCIGSLRWEELLAGASRKAGFTEGCSSPPVVSECDVFAIEAPVSDRVSGSWDKEGVWCGVTAVSSLLHGLLSRWTPKTIVLLGRRNVLSERLGASFAELLLELNTKGYVVSWMIVNLSWLGIPQDSSRVVVLARRIKRDKGLKRDHEFLNHFSQKLLDCPAVSQSFTEWCSVKALLDARRPRVGLRVPSNANPFGSRGVASHGLLSFGSFRFTGNPVIQPGLKAVIGESEGWKHSAPVSVRFVSRQGRTGLQVKSNGVAHSMGPSVSAWPLMALPEGDLNKLRSRGQICNWRRAAYGHDVFRLTPERALSLFGHEAEPLIAELRNATLSVSDAYRIVSATVPPRLVRRLVSAFA